MKHQVKQLDFSGQNIYVGLDTHKKQITVTILGERLSHKTFSQPPDPNVLVHYLKKKFPGANYYAAYEAGFSGFWLQESLQEQGVNCIVVNAADVPTKDKERKQKRDPMDSRKIARSLRNKELEAIHIPGKRNQHDRALVRTRFKVVGNLTRCKNRIKSFLYFLGIEFPEHFTQSGTHWSRLFMNWLEQLDLGENSGNVKLSILLEEAEFLRKLLLKANRAIRELSRTTLYLKRVNLLMSVPGIGRLIAMVILTELEDIHRFKSLDQLCSYVGLIPNVSGSDEKERVGDITKRSNKMLRSMLVESSWVAARKDPALTLKYNELCGRMKSNKAIIRIARKLLNRIRYILLYEQEYQLAIVA
jgi:transposase